ncbi:MFS transporter [Bacteroides nordii]|uniref:MFS transporter n=1 Tax=Bacteroides nordii TaxID=291645 RepID=UPI0026DB3ACC|nr:MFS transporter [Bacteroides nordii]
MIYKNGKEITGIIKGGRAITAVYKGAKLVWEAINSCFGKGFWINSKGWSNKDGWKQIKS